MRLTSILFSLLASIFLIDAKLAIPASLKCRQACQGLKKTALAAKNIHVRKVITGVKKVATSSVGKAVLGVAAAATGFGVEYKGALAANEILKATTAKLEEAKEANATRANPGPLCDRACHLQNTASAVKNLDAKKVIAGVKKAAKVVNKAATSPVGKAVLGVAAAATGLGVAHKGFIAVNAISDAVRTKLEESKVVNKTLAVPAPLCDRACHLQNTASAVKNLDAKKVIAGVKKAAKVVKKAATSPVGKAVLGVSAAATGFGVAFKGMEAAHEIAVAIGEARN
jgi:hypothetical protein